MYKPTGLAAAEKQGLLALTALLGRESGFTILMGCCLGVLSGFFFRTLDLGVLFGVPKKLRVPPDDSIFFIGVGRRKIVGGSRTGVSFMALRTVKESILLTSC